MTDIILKLNEQQYTGWTTIQISRGIEQLAGSFELGLTRDVAERRVKVRPGDACTVNLSDGQPLITGYVDTVAAQFDATSHSITISGRDKTGDLVDCSAVHEAGQWQNKTLYDITKDVCRPFGVEVVKEVSAGDAFVNESINDSETAFELIERMYRQHGLLLTSDGAGRLVITRSGQGYAPGALGVDGVPLLSGSVDDSWTERYSLYIGKGSHPDDGLFEPEAAAAPGAQVTDQSINRYRPLVLLAEDNATPASLKKRATFERNVRLGRSRRVMVSVQGWQHAARLWAPNQRTHLKEPKLNVDRELLIVSVTYTLDQGGTRAQLTLADPGAYDILQTPPADPTKDWLL